MISRGYLSPFRPRSSMRDWWYYDMPWSLWDSGPLRMGRAFAEKSPLPLVCLVATAGSEKVA